jgi:DNA invertase Pin-like site-specific DNA recombinase
MKTACYVRVSTIGQNERGQRNEVRKWANAHGLTDLQWFIDKESGDTLDRPAFARLQRAIFDGTVGTVLVWKLDRLSRNLRDGINTLTDWLGKGVRLVSVTQGLDFSGTTGKLIASVLFAVAEMEQSTRRERQAVGIAQAKAEGKYKGRQPGSTQADPTCAKQLKRQGLTDDEIASALCVTRRTIQRYLHVRMQRNKS